MFLFAFAFGVVFAPTSLAQAKVVQLAYEAEAGLDCPTESEFRTDVERRLGSDPPRAAGCVAVMPGGAVVSMVIV